MPYRKWTLNQRAQRGAMLYLTVFAAWCFLNVFINLNYPAPSPSPMFLVLPSLEVWGALLLLSLMPRITPPLAKGLYILLLILLLAIRLFRVGDVVVPEYFNRPFNLYIDSEYVPDLLHLLWHSFSVWTFFSMAIVFVIGLVLVCWGLWSIDSNHSQGFRTGSPPPRVLGPNGHRGRFGAVFHHGLLPGQAAVTVHHLYCPPGGGNTVHCDRRRREA